MPDNKFDHSNAIEIIQPNQPLARSRQVVSLVAAEVDAETSIDILALVRRYIWLALALSLLGIIGGIVSVILATPMYHSRLLLEVQPAQSGKRSGGSTEQQEEAVLQTQMLMMRSSGFLKRVVSRMQAETLPVTPVRNDFFTKVRTKLRPEMRNSAQLMEDGVEAAAGSLNVKVINKTNLLEITAESLHPELAANFVNTVGSEFIDQNLQSRSIDAQRTGQLLAAQVEETKSRLKEAEDKLQAFVRGSGNLFASQETTLADSTLGRFQGELAGAQAERIAKQSRYERFLKAKPDEVMDLLEDPALRTQIAKLSELRQQRNLLTMKFTSNHYKVQQVDVQIRDVEQTIKKESGTALDKLKNDYESSVRRERLMAGAHAGAAGQVSSQAGQAAQYAALKREVDISKQAYSQILLQASEASIANALPQNNMRMVDQAVPFSEPMRPKPATNIAMGAMLGLALTGGIAFLRERMDRSLKQPGSARELLNTRELGVIPSIEAAEQMPRSLRIRISLKSKSMMSKAFRMNTGRTSKELMGWQQKSYFAESFRHTMASILRQDGYSKVPQVLLVTSPNPSEGKTMISSNLAISMAETGRRVLIIDADFRRPRVHSMFGLANTFGLGNILSDWSSIEAQPVVPGILPTQFGSLFVLVNGPEMGDLSRVLYSDRLGLLLQRLRNTYDIILIDAPPVLQIADTRIIDQLADGIVLVLRSGSTDRKSALEAYRCLHEDGGNIIGTVLNDWRPTRRMADSYYSYVRDGDEDLATGPPRSSDRNL